MGQGMSVFLSSIPLRMICVRLWRLRRYDPNHKSRPIAQTLVFCASQGQPTTILATFVCVCWSTHLANHLVTIDTQMDVLLRFLPRLRLPLPPPVLRNLVSLRILRRQLPQIPRLSRLLNLPQTSPQPLRPSPAQQHLRHTNRSPVQSSLHGG